MFERIRVVRFQPCRGRANEDRLLCEGSDGNWYFCKPWNSEQPRTINYHHQLRPVVVTKIAAGLGCAVVDVVVLKGLKPLSNGEEVDLLGARVMEASCNYDHARLEARESVTNREDIIRFLFLDLLFLNDDRKMGNSNRNRSPLVGGAGVQAGARRA